MIMNSGEREATTPSPLTPEASSGVEARGIDTACAPARERTKSFGWGYPRDSINLFERPGSRSLTEEGGSRRGGPRTMDGYCLDLLPCPKTRICARSSITLCRPRGCAEVRNASPDEAISAGGMYRRLGRQRPCHRTGGPTWVNRSDAAPAEIRRDGRGLLRGPLEHDHRRRGPGGDARQPPEVGGALLRSPDDRTGDRRRRDRRTGSRSACPTTGAGSRRWSTRPSTRTSSRSCITTRGSD